MQKQIQFCTVPYGSSYSQLCGPRGQGQVSNKGHSYISNAVIFLRSCDSLSLEWKQSGGLRFLEVVCH